jgi:hypothetical protein
MQFIDSGSYRVYAIYANGCETDSATTATVKSCYVTVSGTIFDDANGNGIIDNAEIATTNSTTLYAVLSDTNGIIQATAPVAANGTFSMATAPAYLTGMTLTADTFNPAIGTTPTGAWPSRWVGTGGNYGSNNLNGTGTVLKTYIPVSTGISNVTGILMGYDRLPTTVARNYVIPYPMHYSKKKLVRANSVGVLSGSDPEDGVIGPGKKFMVTSISGMNGNSLYYDANGDSILQASEKITAATIIAAFDTNRLYTYFTGTGSASASFSYSSVDAAGQPDPTPSTYMMRWTGALPVKLISFTADKYSDSQAKLAWVTASEINNDHFDIERSADAASWSKIGEVKGAGNSNEDITYSMMDDAPLTGANYYRLKQVDIDGNFEYSDIQEVDFGSSVQGTIVMTIYPNPLISGKILNIALAGDADPTIKQVTITTEMGQIVYDRKMSDAQGYKVPDLSLPTGVYIVNVLSQSGEKFSSKIVVQK